MSSGKFASITANLLSRKGEAQPSTLDVRQRVFGQGQQRIFEPPSGVPPTDERAAERGAFVRFRAEPEPQTTRDLRLEAIDVPPEKPQPELAPVAAPIARQVKEHPTEPARTEKPRRMFVLLTPGEYERLGIVAVKRDTSRHQLLREALDTFMAWAVEEYRTDCACVSGQGCRGICE